MEKQISKLLMSAFMAIFVGLTGFTGSVMAVTPDGLTPANEGVCDTVKGATPGLYGLCVAYCEAQDLDLLGDQEPPNNKILDNYNRKKQAGDPDMPCLRVPCPCYDESDLTAITNSGGVLSCSISETSAVLRNTTVTQSASINMSGPLCRRVDTVNNVPRSVVFKFDATAAQTCYDLVVNACATVQ